MDHCASLMNAKYFQLMKFILDTKWKRLIRSYAVLGALASLVSTLASQSVESVIVSRLASNRAKLVSVLFKKKNIVTLGF